MLSKILIITLLLSPLLIILGMVFRGMNMRISLPTGLMPQRQQKEFVVLYRRKRFRHRWLWPMVRTVILIGSVLFAADSFGVTHATLPWYRGLNHLHQTLAMAGIAFTIGIVICWGGYSNFKLVLTLIATVVVGDVLFPGLFLATFGRIVSHPFKAAASAKTVNDVAWLIVEWLIVIWGIILFPLFLREEYKNK